MADDDSVLQIDTREGVSTWTLNRPERKNAIDLPLARALHQASLRAGADPEVRAVLVRGAGGNFSSGGDLTGGGAADDDRPPRSAAASTLEMMRTIYGEMTHALHRLSKPTVAMVEGVAAGAGVNLALACDLVYAAEDARFCEIFVRRSLAVDCGGSWLLPRIVGLQKAKELAFFGDWLSAEEAERAGLVTGVFSPEALEREVRERVATLASRPPVALSLIKQGLNASFEMTMADALEAEATAQGLCTSTEDFKEGIRAFMQRREPKFTGG